MSKHVPRDPTPEDQAEGLRRLAFRMEAAARALRSAANFHITGSKYRDDELANAHDAIKKADKYLEGQRWESHPPDVRNTK